MSEIADIVAQRWDVIIVGTGIGGATLGYALAKAGKKVLFCEKGRSYLGDTEALTGCYAEQAFARPSVPQPKHQALLARAGRCWDQIEDCSGSKIRRFIPFIGTGIGGSSALYGNGDGAVFPGRFHPAR